MRFASFAIPAFCVAVFTGQVAEANQPPSAAEIQPGEPVDFEPLAFYPERWKKRGIELKMIPWRGEEVVFLTTGPDYDHEVIAGLLHKLDSGWKHYRKLTSSQPRAYKQLDGQPTLAAVPDFSLTCGYGCGMVGATGIELGAFYRSDYRAISRNHAAVPDYYFYEMGRNYYTFGDRHSLFITGFAVFMRYVCVDHLDLQTDVALRQTIEDAQEVYAASDITFLQAFTTLDGLDEKTNRLKDADGESISPTDQPVMYASAMLRLRRECGGDDWVQRFFTQLRNCPNVRVDPEADEAKQAGIRQSMNWLVAASCAAGEDLCPVFVDEWRMPVSEAERYRLEAVDWKAQNLDAGELVRQVLAP